VKNFKNTLTVEAGSYGYLMVRSRRRHRRYRSLSIRWLGPRSRRA
jgi:hypothetical protein